jgi:hypothetical protein
VISSPVPHHPAYGSVQGGSNQTRWPGLPSLSLHPNHISRSAIAALMSPWEPSAIWRLMEMGAPQRLTRNAARAALSGGWSLTDLKNITVRAFYYTVASKSSNDY